MPREGGVCFEALPPPTQDEVERLLRGVLRLLEKRGALPAQGPEDALQAYQAHSLQQRLRWTEVDVRPPLSKQPRCAFMEGGQGRRVPQEAARLLHPPGALLGRPPSAALLGPSAPALTLNMASIPPIRSEPISDSSRLKMRLHRPNLH